MNNTQDETTFDNRVQPEQEQLDPIDLDNRGPDDPRLMDTDNIEEEEGYI